MGSVFGGGSSNTTTTVRNELPAWIENAGRNTFNFASAMANRPLYQYGDQGPAPTWNRSVAGPAGFSGGITGGGGGGYTPSTGSTGFNLGRGGSGAFGGSGSISGGGGTSLLSANNGGSPNPFTAANYKNSAPQINPGTSGGRPPGTGDGGRSGSVNAGISQTITGGSNSGGAFTSGTTPDLTQGTAGSGTGVPYTPPTPVPGTPIGDQRYDRYTAPLDQNQVDAMNVAGNSFDYVSDPLNTAGGVRGLATDMATMGVNTDSTMNDARSLIDQGSSQFTSEDIQRLMDPYIQQALNPAARELREQGLRNQNRIGDKAGMAGAFGGSRMAILEAENQRGTQEALSDLYSRGYSNAYNQATNLARNEYDRAARGAGQLQGQAGLESSLLNQDLNRVLGVGNFALNEAGARGSAVNDYIGQLMGTGAVGRGVDAEQRQEDYQRFQERNNYPTQQLNTLLAAISGVPYEQTTSQTAPGGSRAGDAIGTAASLASLFQMFSSREAKQDFKPVDDEKILKMFRKTPVETYRYKPEYRDAIGDDGGVKIGPMAQDWAKAGGEGGGTVIPMPDIIGKMTSAIRALDERTKNLQAA